MKEASFKKAFGIILIYFVINLFLSLIYSIFKIENMIARNIALSLISIINLMVVVFLLKDKLSGQFEDLKVNIKKYVPIVFKYWVIGFMMMIVVNLIINTLILKDIAPNESANRAILAAYPFYSIIHMCLIGPLTEELLFRLNFKGVFRSRTTFALVTGLMFALMHVIGSMSGLSDLLYMISYGVLGVAFGLIYYDTKNVYASTMAHVVHNTLTISIILLGI